VNLDLPIHKVSDALLPGPGGDISIRIYQPQGDGPFGILVYFHGGGWVIGDLDTADAVCREIATLAEVIVVSVDYRLAPEHVYPAAVQDSYAALQWVNDNLETLQGNGKIGVGGESAGGNLAAVVAQQSRDRGGPPIAFQCLLYPVTDAEMSRPSYSENGSGYLLETTTMEWFWDTYCPDLEQRLNADASPLRAKNLADLPPALVVTAEFDPLRDEGNAYAHALQAAGNSATLMCCEGLVHDFFSTAAVFGCSRGPFEKTINALREHLNS
jgi:acetyl esterase